MDIIPVRSAEPDYRTKMVYGLINLLVIKAVGGIAVSGSLHGRRHNKDFDSKGSYM